MTHPAIPATSGAISDDGSALVRLGFTAEPIVDISNACETPLYSECLARVMVADKLMLNSGDFVEDLEACGRIDLLDSAVIELVLDTLADAPDVALGCNISPRTLADPAAWRRILHGLHERQALATRLVLEVTETHPLSEMPDLAGQLAQAQQLGCRIAIDDFGSGYSSPQQLQGTNIQWDIVKIDRSCFGDLHDTPSSPRRLQELLSEASRFAPVVVVEGIETYQRLSLAQDAGARFGQGWLFDGSLRDRWIIPRPASQLTAAVKAYEAIGQQMRRPTGSSGQSQGQGTYTPCTWLRSIDKGFSNPLATNAADLLGALMERGKIGEAS